MNCEEFLRSFAADADARAHRKACAACDGTERALLAYGRAELPPPPTLLEMTLAAVRAPAGARPVFYEIRRFAAAMVAAVTLAIGIALAYDVAPVMGRVGEEVRSGFERVKEIPRAIEQGVLGILEKGRDS